MGCLHWVDKGHIACTQYADSVSSACSKWKDEGQNECSAWKDEGENKCSSWADEGYDSCCDWAPCSWFCDALVWVSKWVCKGWYWVANWVCQGWYWLANFVCQAYVLVVKTWCAVWSWIAELTCTLWDDVVCSFRSLLKAISWLFGGRPRSSNPILHVFVLMLENRSFDHMLGFSGITGTDARTGGTTAVDGLIGNSFVNFAPSAPGVPVAPSVEAAFKLNRPADDDPGHEFGDTVVALCGAGTAYTPGTPYPPIDNSGFIAEYATMPDRDSDKIVPQDPTTIMKCYSPDRIRVLNALAREFAVCDNWFSSLPGPTWPNRFFIHAGSSGGLDDSPSGLQVVTSELVDGYRFNNGTIFERLEDACIEWRIFAGDHLPQSLAIADMTINELQGRVRDYDDFADSVNDPDFGARYVFIEPNYGNDLPKITPNDFTCGNSQHPLDDVTRGERLIKDVYETIRNSPHWESSVLLVVYDEHGGFCDHVPPPVAVPPGDGISDPANNHNGFLFDRLGVRVPAVIASPFISRGTIDHTVYDHTSLLATLEKLLDLEPLTQRDANANDFMHLFRSGPPRTDCPTSLIEPADSGFHCEEVFLLTGDPVGTVAPVPEDLDQRTHSRARSRPPKSLIGFLEVALMKALTLARGRDKPQIIADYNASTTRETALSFMRAVAAMAPRREFLRVPRKWRNPPATELDTALRRARTGS